MSGSQNPTNAWKWYESAVISFDNPVVTSKVEGDWSIKLKVPPIQF